MFLIAALSGLAALVAQLMKNGICSLTRSDGSEFNYGDQLDVEQADDAVDVDESIARDVDRFDPHYPHTSEHHYCAGGGSLPEEEMEVSKPVQMEEIGEGRQSPKKTSAGGWRHEDSDDEEENDIRLRDGHHDDPIVHNSTISSQKPEMAEKVKDTTAETSDDTTTTSTTTTTGVAPTETTPTPTPTPTQEILADAQEALEDDVVAAWDERRDVPEEYSTPDIKHCLGDSLVDGEETDLSVDGPSFAWNENEAGEDHSNNVVEELVE